MHACVCACDRWIHVCTLTSALIRTYTHNVQEATLSDVPVMMTMKEEIPSGKLYVAYKNGTIDVVDEITAETQRFLTVDCRVSEGGHTPVGVTTEGAVLCVHVRTYIHT